MNNRDLYDMYASGATKGLTITLTVLCFVSAGGSLLTLMTAETLQTVLGTAPNVGLSILNILFYTTFGILLHKTKQWGIALTITIYAGFFTLTWLMQGMLSGVGVLVIGILCTIKLKQLLD